MGKLLLWNTKQARQGKQFVIQSAAIAMSECSKDALIEQTAWDIRVQRILWQEGVTAWKDVEHFSYSELRAIQGIKNADIKALIEVMQGLECGAWSEQTALEMSES